MANTIKYGIVGAGHLGNYHAAQLNKISCVDFVGIYDVSLGRAKKLSVKHNSKAFNSINTLLSLCDAVSIATPASTHFDCIVLALEYGCHVFIEKPFTKKIQEAKKIIKIQKNKNLKIQVGHIERFNSAFLSFVALDPLPLFIESHRLCLYNNRGLDVDVILDLMIHDIDLVLLLINSDIRDIQANGSAVLTDSVDIANARLEFKNGSTVNLTASRVSLKQMRQMRVFEKKSYSVLDFQAQTINRWFVNSSGKLKEKNVFVSTTNALFEELNVFVDSIQNNSPIKVGSKEALAALAVASKIQKIIEKKNK